MAESRDERFSGDIPVTPGLFAEETRPSLSFEVVATYVADAVRSSPGIVSLIGSPDLRCPSRSWQGLPGMKRESTTRGVVVHEDTPGNIDVEVHVRVAWGVAIPELARRVEEAVRARVKALLDLDLGGVTLFIDEIDGPPEVEDQPIG
jgi:uncharacterized alkaline shock family protein YloU